MPPRNQKIRLRSKARAEKRHRIFAALRWLIVIAVLGVSVRLGAQKAAQTNFFPIKTLKAELSSTKSTGAYASWRELAAAQMEKAWKNKNRLTFTRDIFSLRRQLLNQYPFIKDMSVHWLDFFRRGDLRVTFSFRNPIAIQSEKGKVSCLDADLVSFPCPEELSLSESGLVSVSGLERNLLKLSLERMPAIQETLPQGEQIVHAESLGAEAVSFGTVSGRNFRLSASALASSDVLEIVLDRLKTVLLDLRSRQEEYNAVDMTLARANGESRIIVAIEK